MTMPKPKHFLTGEEFSAEEIFALLEEAQFMKVNRAEIKQKPLAGKSVAIMFEKPSLRTRLSFTVGIHELGGQPIELLSSNAKNEDPEDAIRVLQGMVHALMLRTFDHNTLTRMQSKATIPIINGLSDDHHPCQALADLLTLKQNFKSLKGLTLTYIGDGNNVLHSLLLLAPIVGVNVNYACPKGYEPNAQILKRALKRAKDYGAKITAFTKPEDAVKGAHALYTDVWASMGQEKEQKKREKAFKGYQINMKLLAKAQPNAIVMHCLPMNKGQEITQEVVDHKSSQLFAQAENRLHVQKALLRKLLSPAPKQAKLTHGLQAEHRPA